MFARNSLQKGFSLLELTIGIVVLSIALMIMTGALFPQAQRSVDPWYQVRSAELAKSMMNEILARKFDERSFTLGELRCSEYESGTSSAVPCATQAELNACATTEEANRADYDDVDDFNCFSATGDNITNISGQNLTNVYRNFTVSVRVNYEGALKRVTVTVSPPSGIDIVYSAYKANY